MKKSFDAPRVISIALFAAMFILIIYLACVPDSKSRVMRKGGEAAAQNTAVPVTAKPVPAPSDESRALHIYFADVGQGDCAFLLSPNGHTMLIDSGESEAASKVLSLLDRLHVEKLDLLVASHMHSDHVGAMPAVLYSHEAGAFVMSTLAEADKALSCALDDNNVPIIRADAETSLDWDPDVKLELLSPLPGAAYRDENQGSIMMRLEYGNTSILFTGDAGYQAEDMALSVNDASVFRADILKLGHHGSSDATTPRFLHAVDPSFAVVCCGKNNSYGHPHQSVLNQLSKRDIQVYRTDLDAEVHIVMDGKEVFIESER